MRKQRKPQYRRILRLLMLLCVVGIGVSAYVLYRDSQEYAQGDAAYRQLAQLRLTPAGTPGAETIPPAAETGQESAISTTGSLDFQPLAEVNPHVVAWLESQEIGIDYPVVRSEDNEFYLDHLFTGERNKLGSLFMDYRNRGDFSDPNTVIYGHNMKDGSMFSALTRYQDQDFFDAAPRMVLYTPQGDYTVEWFAGMTIDGSAQSIQMGFENEKDFEAYISSLKDQSTFTSPVRVAAGDRIVTLCTCSYEWRNARYALYGKLSQQAGDFMTR